MNRILSIISIILIQGAFHFSDAQEIILIRHAKVGLETEGWMGSKKAAQLRQLYDISPIYKFSSDSVRASLPERKTDSVYVSDLNRSISTGWLLFGDSAIILSTPFLNEFDLEIIWLPVMLPYKGWTSISRIFWVLGYKKGDSETHKEAKKRVKKIADFIEEKLRYNEQVIFVTHGFLNRNISHEMKSRGWRIIQNESKKNLGATVLVK